MIKIGKVFLFLLCASFVLSSSSVYSQINYCDSFPSVRNKKGDLIAVNEMHGVATNVAVYTDILKKLR